MSMVTARVVPTLREVRFTQTEREFVYLVALKFLKDAEAAQEVAQEALLLAFRHRHSFLGNARFTTWLYRIAVTSALMHLRRTRRLRRTQILSFDEAPSLQEQCSPQPSPEEVAAAGETLVRCERAAAEMGPSYEAAFLLRFVDGLSDAEVARRLSLRDTTAKTRAYRARAHVKRRLAQARDEWRHV
jgi:RNA polymerase sigma-70 factor (ECF subfamily)